MPQQNIAGPGQLLPPPQALYPVSVYNSPYIAPSNQVELGPGQWMYVPAGDWIAGGGVSTTVQWLNPTSMQWTNFFAIGTAWAQEIKSDGFNFRIANLTDTAFGAIITTPGTGYVQASTSVTPGTGNSTWVPVVGGALGAFTIVNGGSGYTVPPLVFIPSPPAPGIPATATAALTAGVVSGITIRQAGAGYLTAPPVLLLPAPGDPSTNIVNATATVALTGAGTITAVFLANFGAPLTTAPTLTVNGVGASAVVTTNPATVTAAANDLVTLQPR